MSEFKKISAIVDGIGWKDGLGYLIKNKESFIVSQDELNKLKAEAVRDWVNQARSFINDDAFNDAHDYANKLERGEG